MNRPMQMFAALMIAAVAFATLGPPSARPHLRFLGQNGEHGLAFLIVGVVVGLAFPRRPWMTAAIGVVLTGVLELAQLVMPGRHARWSDFVVDAAALCLGLLVAAVVNVIRQRLRTVRSV